MDREVDLLQQIEALRERLSRLSEAGLRINESLDFVPYHNVIVPSGQSLPHYLVPNPLLRKVVVIKARKHPAASVVESHN